MSTLTEIIIAQGLANRFITTSKLNQLITGTPARRYGLVNRALKKGDLLRVQRGLYILADRYRSEAYHPFSLTQALSPGSYISFETALSYHGWIPERVYTTASVISGRKSRLYDNEKMGHYSFHPLAIRTGYFLELVNSIKFNQQKTLMANPSRALLDLVCLRKISWKGMDWLTEGLRIDIKALGNITQEEVETLKMIYKHKRIQLFIMALSMELNLD